MQPYTKPQDRDMNNILGNLWDETRVYRYLDQKPDRDYFSVLYLDKEEAVYLELQVGPRPATDGFLATLDLVNIGGRHIGRVNLACVMGNTLLDTRAELGIALDECLKPLNLLVEAL